MAFFFLFLFVFPCVRHFILTTFLFFSRFYIFVNGTYGSMFRVWDEIKKIPPFVLKHFYLVMFFKLRHLFVCLFLARFIIPFSIHSFFFIDTAFFYASFLPSLFSKYSLISEFRNVLFQKIPMLSVIRLSMRFSF